MKYFLILLFFPASLFAQQKKDSKVIVTVSDTSNLFNRVALQFYERGYTLEQKDQQVGFISTTEKPLKKTSGSVKIRALIKDSTITFTAVNALDIEVEILGIKSERTFEPVGFFGAKNSINMKSWNEMKSIAESFGGTITYSK